MNKRITRTIYLLFFCSLSSFAQQQEMTHDMSTMNMADMDMSNMNGMVHDHKPRSIPENAQTPQINLTLFRDEKTGFNLHLTINNFEIEPPEFEDDMNRQAKAIVLDGHAHLYVNGEKISRLYGEFVHLPQSLFNPGINIVMVSLNAHNHDIWTINNQQIMASVILNPAQERFLINSFSYPSVK